MNCEDYTDDGYIEFGIDQHGEGEGMTKRDSFFLELGKQAGMNMSVDLIEQLYLNGYQPASWLKTFKRR